MEFPCGICCFLSLTKLKSVSLRKGCAVGSNGIRPYQQPPPPAPESGSFKILEMRRSGLGKAYKLLVFGELTGRLSPESLIRCLFAILGGRMSCHGKSSKVCHPMPEKGRGHGALVNTALYQLPKHRPACVTGKLSL